MVVLIQQNFLRNLFRNRKIQGMNVNSKKMPIQSYKTGLDFEIGYQNVIGIKRKRLCVKYDLQNKEIERLPSKVKFGDRCVVCNNTVIYEGSIFGDDCFIDDFVRVGAYSRVGSGTMLLYGAKIYESVVIGRDCRIAGFLPHNVVIGNNVTMMGTITHKYRKPLDWTRDEPSPVIKDNAVVGLGAVIVGGIVIGENAYVAANATVTKDVPDNMIALNTNGFLTIEEFEIKNTLNIEWAKKEKTL